MPEQEKPENGSLFSARLIEFEELRISRFIPNFLDYIELPSFRIAEIKTVARKLLAKDEADSGSLANKVKNAIEGKK